MCAKITSLFNSRWGKKTTSIYFVPQWPVQKIFKMFCNNVRHFPEELNEVLRLLLVFVKVRMLALLLTMINFVRKLKKLLGLI